MGKKDNFIQRILADIARKINKLKAEGEASDEKTPPTDDEKRMADRLVWLNNVAAAHSQGAMPWRSGASTKQDEDWCEQVIDAVRKKRARPAHPDPDIEKFLSDGYAT